MPRLKTTNTNPTNLGIQNALNHTTTKETTTNLSEKKLVGYRFYVNEKATFRDGKTAIERTTIVNAIKEEGGKIRPPPSCGKGVVSPLANGGRALDRL